MKHPESKVVIIGAGLAGLSCAVRLHSSNIPFEIFEASDGVGGRVRTDQVDGFLLDRGFQVYLDAYENAGELLDLDALHLKRFEPGALVWKNGKLHKLIDVFRRPAGLWQSATAPIGRISDKLRVAKLRASLLKKPVSEIWEAADQTTEQHLRQLGFSETMIDDFFRGFYGGIFLEEELQTSSRCFEFTYKMFSQGYATLPENGMQAIPDQLAQRLPSESIHLNTPIVSIDGNTVHTADSEISASQIVIATDGKAAHQLFPQVQQPKWNSTSCLYFSASDPPTTEPMIVLKGDRKNGLINNLCVPSFVSENYAPPGKSLISISLLGDHRSHSELADEVKKEAVDWFGPAASEWTHLRTEHIHRALPVTGSETQSPSSEPDHIHICGDHTINGSIEAAIQSGSKVAKQISEKIVA